MAGKGNKLVIFVPVALVLIGGGVFGAATLGFLKIPGITPKSKMGIAKLYGEAGSKMYGEGKNAKVAQVKPKPKPFKPSAAPKPKPKPTSTIDPLKGAAAIAEVWNGIETAKLLEIVKDWKDDDLARVLANMESSKAANLLAELDPKRASKVSAAIQAQASVVPIKS